MNNVYYRDFAGIVIANARAPQRFPENTGNEGAASSGGDRPLSNSGVVRLWREKA